MARRRKKGDQTPSSEDKILTYLCSLRLRVLTSCGVVVAGAGTRLAAARCCDSPAAGQAGSCRSAAPAQQQQLAAVCSRPGHKTKHIRVKNYRFVQALNVTSIDCRELEGIELRRDLRDLLCGRSERS